MSLRGRRHGGGRKNELVFVTTAGPTTTFDPKITGVDGVWFFDDGTTLAASSGSEISKTFAADGLHRAVYRPASGGLAAITAIDFNNDLVTNCNLSRLLNCVTCAGYVNADLTIRLIEISRIASTVSFSRCPKLSGSLLDLPPSATTVILYQDVGVSASSISHLVSARDIRIYDMGWDSAGVGIVIDSMWAARANYTYATPALQIGGTNQAPTGNVIAPEEGTDWHLDGATWIPLTAGAKAYDLAKDVNGEGFNRWSITYTRGSITP